MSNQLAWNWCGKRWYPQTHWTFWTFPQRVRKLWVLWYAAGPLTVRTWDVFA